MFNVYTYTCLQARKFLAILTVFACIDFESEEHLSAKQSSHQMCIGSSYFVHLLHVKRDERCFIRYEKNILMPLLLCDDDILPCVLINHV